MSLHDYIPTFPPPPVSYLHPLPNTTPLTPIAAVLPPLVYYFALLLLPPFPSRRFPTLINLSRHSLALTSAFLFFRLPLRYYVPFSVGLTYQVALVGLYGGCRVLDVFFITPHFFHHIPRRVKYQQAPRNVTLGPRKGPDAESYFSLHFLQPALGEAVTETATTDSGWPLGWRDRASWALELELSMRGAGFTWTSADVRHTKMSWRPSVRDRVHSIVVHACPVLLVSWAVIRDVYVHYLQDGKSFDDLPLFLQLILTAALGGFLMSAFSFGHSAFAILLSPLAPHPLSYFPPLYTARVWELTSVRGFWSYGWHRLFSRLFLVYGVWPGEWIEKRLTAKGPQDEADVGKVVGAFLSSAVVHSFAGHCAVGAWRGAWGEAWFFAENGLAVVVEECFKRGMYWMRRSHEVKRGIQRGGELERWYDGLIGRIWWASVLLYTGRNFARGWVPGLVREIAGA